MNLKLTEVLSKLSSNHNNCLEFTLTKDFSQGGVFYHRHCLEFLAHGDNEEQNNFSVHFQYCFIILIDNAPLTAGIQGRQLTSSCPWYHTGLRNSLGQGLACVRFSTKTNFQV